MPVRYDNSSSGGGDDAFLAGFLGGVMESGENVWSNLQRKRKEERDYQLQVDKFDLEKKYAKTAEDRAAAQERYNEWTREQAKLRAAEEAARRKVTEGREDEEYGWLKQDRLRQKNLQAKQDEAIAAGEEAAGYEAGLPVQRTGLMQQYDEAFDTAGANAEMSGIALDEAAASPLSGAFGWANQQMADELKTRVARVYSNDAADRFSTVLDAVRQEANIKVQNIAAKNPVAAANLAAAVEKEFLKIQDEMEKRVAGKEVENFDKQPWANTEFGQSILEQVASARASGQDPREIVSLVNTKRQERAAQLNNLQRINTARNAIQRGVEFYNTQSLSSGAYAAERISADNKSSRLQALLVDLETASADDLERIVKEYKEITGSTGLPGFKEQMEFAKEMAGLSTKTQTPDPTGGVTTTETPVFTPQEVRDYALGVQARNVGIPSPNPESGDAIYNTRPAQESLGIPSMPNESGQLGRYVGALSVNDRKKWSDTGRQITWDGKPALPTSDGKVYTAGYQVVRDENLYNGKWTMIPTVWDGRAVDPKEATKRAIKYLENNPGESFYNPGLDGSEYDPQMGLRDALDRQQAEAEKERAANSKQKTNKPVKQTNATAPAASQPTQPAQPAAQPQAKPEPRPTGSAKADLAEATLGNQPTFGRSTESANGYSFTAGVEGYLGSFGDQTGPLAAQVADLEKRLSVAPKTDAEMLKQEGERRQLEQLKALVAKGAAYKTTDAGKKLMKSAQTAEAMINQLQQLALSGGGFYEKAIRELKNLPARPSTPEEVSAWRKYVQRNFGDSPGTPKAPGDLGLRAQRIAAEADAALSELGEGLNAGLGA